MPAVSDTLRWFAGLVLAVTVGCDRSPAKVHVYNPSADAHSDVAKALAQAHVDHKRVLLIFGGNWCIECRVLDRHLHEPAAEAIVNASFHVVDIDIGGGNDDFLDGSPWKNQDISRQYGVPLNFGVPVVAVLDADGRLLFTQHGEWTPEGGPTADAVVEFLKRWSPP